MRGYLFAIAATAIWSGNFVVARGLSDSIPPVSLAFWRWVVAVIVFLPFGLRPLIAERNLLKPNLRYLVVTAFLGITVFNTLIYVAGHTTSALNLSLISIIFPIFVILLMRVFYGERIGVRKVFGITLVITGVIMLITKGNLAVLMDISFAVGDIWMLTAALIFAIFSIQLKRKPKDMSIWALQFSLFIVGLIFLLPLYVWETRMTAPVQWDMTTVGSILYIGVFASFAAFLLWNYAVMSIGPAKAGMVYYMLPLFSGILAFLFIGEGVSSMHLISAVLILSGIFAANHEMPRNKA